MKKSNPFVNNARRQFLNTISKAGLSLPTLRASALGAGMLVGRDAMAATGVQRVVFIYVPGGAPGASNWLPSSNLTLKKCSAPLESVKSECVFFSGTSVIQDGSPNGGHGLTQRVLGGFEAPLTIDFALEESIGAVSPTASIRMGVATGSLNSISSKNRQEVADYVDNPTTVFEKLFGGGQDLGDVGTNRRKSILDINRDALKKIKSRLGGLERQRLDEHSAAIERIESDLDAAAAASVPEACKNPDWNTDGFSGPITDVAFNTIFDLHLDSLVLALKCNVTKVGVIQLGTHQSEFTVPGMDGTLHGVIHGGQGGFDTYCAKLHENVATLISRLKEEKDFDGTPLLDSTLVVKVTDMGNGSGHTADNAPFLIAGGGSSIQRGRVQSCDEHPKILDSVCQALGVYGTVPSYSSSPATGVLS